MQNADSASNMNPLVTEETQQSLGDKVNRVNDGSPSEISSKSFNTLAEVNQINVEQAPSQIPSQTEVKSELGIEQKSNPCRFSNRKAKITQILGCLPEYAIFRADFKHLIESRYMTRDSITLLLESPLNQGLF